MILQPYMLVIDMEKLVSNMMLPAPRPGQGKENAKDLCFSFKYCRLFALDNIRLRQIAVYCAIGLQDFFSVEHKSGFSPTVLVELLEAGELKGANGAGKLETQSVLFHFFHLLYL